mmetsp:Transcript_9876/g.18778  ORF Transcript_9876/g.18778 Transcript_9876/m.18778 type:complete len:107 (+) Transcript_9876:2692-3012(+)
MEVAALGACGCLGSLLLSVPTVATDDDLGLRRPRAAAFAVPAFAERRGGPNDSSGRQYSGTMTTSGLHGWHRRRWVLRQNDPGTISWAIFGRWRWQRGGRGAVLRR